MEVILNSDKPAINPSNALPRITVNKPEESKDLHIAIIVCPGGSYQMHFMMDAISVSDWLVEQGITTIMLEYRLPEGNRNIPFEDLQEAFAITRSKADEWGINPEKIGLLGTSAGGHLVAMASSDKFAEELGITPAFNILFYPVITMGKYIHRDSCIALLGDNPSSQDLTDYSVELHVTSKTPPTIILTGSTDEIVSPMNSVLYFEALLKHNVLSGLYLFPEGKHGFHIYDGYQYTDLSYSLLYQWVKEVTGIL